MYKKDGTGKKILRDMKYIDDCAILVLIGWILFLGGICFNMTWLFLSGFVWLCGAILLDEQMYKIDHMFDNLMCDEKEMGK